MNSVDSFSIEMVLVLDGYVKREGEMNGRDYPERGKALMLALCFFVTSFLLWMKLRTSGSLKFRYPYILTSFILKYGLL